MNEQEWLEQLADRSRIAQLEAALGFYANADNYAERWADDGDGRWDEMPSPIDNDGGSRARMVLGLPALEPKPAPEPIKRFYYSPPKLCPTGEHRYHRAPDGLVHCERRAKQLAQEAAEREAMIRWRHFDDDIATLKAAEAV